MQNDEQWRALGRAVGGGRDGVRCFLVYEGEGDRRAGAERLAADLGATETVELDADTATLGELSRQVAEAPGDGPVQITGVEHWPGGPGKLGEQLGTGLTRFKNECPRAVLVWARDSELNDILKGQGDLHSRVDGAFDLRPEGREGEAPQRPDGRGAYRRSEQAGESRAPHAQQR